jgi:hypothetical protein
VLGYLSHVSLADTFPEAATQSRRARFLLARGAHFVKLYFEWDWPGNSMEAMRHTPMVFFTGRPAEAFRQIQLAQQRDSLSLSVNTDLGFLLLHWAM